MEMMFRDFKDLCTVTDENKDKTRTRQRGWEE